MADPTAADRMRLDKWLWAARLYKTRGEAADDAALGRIAVNGQTAKAGRELKPGDRVEWRRHGLARAVLVRALSNVRGPAPVAQGLYEETPDSIAAREAAALARRQGSEPAATLEQGRPTKRDRRQLAEWHRWSASADEPD